jgi:hypothetical protein
MGFLKIVSDRADALGSIVKLGPSGLLEKRFHQGYEGFSCLVRAEAGDDVDVHVEDVLHRRFPVALDNVYPVSSGHLLYLERHFLDVLEQASDFFARHLEQVLVVLFADE